MDYLVKFNLTKETAVNGEKVVETFPISYKSRHCKSKDQAIKKAKDALSIFNLGDNEENSKYLMNFAEIKRIPEEAPILKTDYFQMYKDLLLDIGKKVQETGNNRIEGQNGAVAYFNRTSYRDDDERISVSVGGTSISYEKKGDYISLYNNPFTDPRGSAMGYMYVTICNDRKIRFSSYGGGRDIEGNLSLEEAFKHTYGGSDPFRLSSVNNFFDALPEFKKEAIAKKQAIIQEEYAKKFHEDQVRMIEEEEKAEREVSKKQVKENKVLEEVR